MLIKWANKKIQQRRPFQGGDLMKMHSRLTQSYNINGMDHLNVIFGSYRTIKRAWLQLLQLPDCKCTGWLYMHLWLSQFGPSCPPIPGHWFSCWVLHRPCCCCVAASVPVALDMYYPLEDAPCSSMCQAYLGAHVTQWSSKWARNLVLRDQMTDLEFIVSSVWLWE